MSNVPKYPGVVGNSKSYSLYLLSDGVGRKLHGTGQCLQNWVPLWIVKGAHASVVSGVRGNWGTVARRLSSTSTRYQLTYNSFPVNTFAGDSAPKQANGEGIKFASGVNWYLIKASATTASKSAMKTVSGGSGGRGRW
jgi:predicted lipoprotein with Yx(FWY)xxD motif